MACYFKWQYAHGKFYENHQIFHKILPKSRSYVQSHNHSFTVTVTVTKLVTVTHTGTVSYSAFIFWHVEIILSNDLVLPNPDAMQVILPAVYFTPLSTSAGHLVPSWLVSFRSNQLKTEAAGCCVRKANRIQGAASREMSRCKIIKSRLITMTSQHKNVQKFLCKILQSSV